MPGSELIQRHEQGLVGCWQLRGDAADIRNLRHGHRSKEHQGYAWVKRYSKPPVAAPNLLERRFSVTEPNKVWVTDITYIRTYKAGSKVAEATGKAVVKKLDSMGRAWESGKVLNAGEVAMSGGGNISAQQITRVGTPA